MLFIVSFESILAKEYNKRGELGHFRLSKNPERLSVGNARVGEEKGGLYASANLSATIF